MTVAIVPHNVNTNEEEVKAFETTIGASLPDDYRGFLLSHNGGRPDFTISRNIVFPVHWTNGQPWAERIDAAFLENLYPLDKACSFSLYSAHHICRIALQLIPDDTISIGATAGNAALLLGIKGENRGRVLAWFAEFAPPEGDEPTHNNVGYVAGSFTAFLQVLRPWTDEDDLRARSETLTR